MSENERKFYDSIYESSRNKIDELDKLGVLEARYMQVLEILMRLRQICCHPALFKSITKFVKNPKDFEAELRKFIKKRSQYEENDEENILEPIME